MACMRDILSYGAELRIGKSVAAGCSSRGYKREKSVIEVHAFNENAV